MLNGIVNKHVGKINICQNDRFLLRLQKFIYEERFDYGLLAEIVSSICSPENTRQPDRTE